jgi:N-acetylmuramoyl-L-alanine amidase
LSNPQEEQKLQQSDYQQKIAKAICSGVVQYFLQT